MMARRKDKEPIAMANMEDYQFTADWFGANIPNWQRWFEGLAGQPDIRFLEIGCYEGRSTVWLLGNVLTDETARIECIDVFGSGHAGDYEERFDHNIKTALGQKKVKKLKGPSQELLRKLKLYSYDVVYIDGSHTAPDVLEDAVLSFRLLKPGGLLVFDDYMWNAFPDPLLVPRLAIDAFLQLYEHYYDLLHREYQVAVRKRKSA